MPSIEMMDKECCKTIVEDMKNIIKVSVAVQFKWTSPKPLQLIDIKALFDHYAKRMTTVALKTQIDEDKPNSITIYCSKFTKYKMKSRFGLPIKLVESSKIIVYGFIHEMRKQHHSLSAIPQDIYNVCAMFYDCLLQIPLDEASPFTLLFAIFDPLPALSIKGWTLLDRYEQCQYLKDDNIYGLRTVNNRMIHLTENVYDFSEVTLKLKSRVKDNIIQMLSKYESTLKRLSSQSVKNWNGSDIIISLIYYLVNIASDHVRQSQTTWEFVEYFRRYCRDMQYNGALFDNDSNKLKNGSVCITKVNEQYGVLFRGRAQMLNNWSILQSHYPYLLECSKCGAKMNQTGVSVDGSDSCSHKY
eukprot:426658_1